MVVQSHDLASMVVGSKDMQVVVESAALRRTCSNLSKEEISDVKTIWDEDGQGILVQDKLLKQLALGTNNSVGENWVSHRHKQVHIQDSVVGDADEMLNENFLLEVIWDEEPHQQLDGRMDDPLECKQAIFKAPIMSNDDIESVFDEISSQVVWDEELLQEMESHDNRLKFNAHGDYLTAIHDKPIVELVSFRSPIVTNDDEVKLFNERPLSDVIWDTEVAHEMHICERAVEPATEHDDEVIFRESVHGLNPPFAVQLVGQSKAMAEVVPITAIQGMGHELVGRPAVDAKVQKLCICAIEVVQSSFSGSLNTDLQIQTTALEKILALRHGFSPWRYEHGLPAVAEFNKAFQCGDDGENARHGEADNEQHSPISSVESTVKLFNQEEMASTNPPGSIEYVKVQEAIVAAQELQSNIHPSARMQWDPGIISATAWGQAVFRGAGNVMTRIWPRRSPAFAAHVLKSQPISKPKRESTIQDGRQQRRRTSRIINRIGTKRSSSSLVRGGGDISRHGDLAGGHESPLPVSSVHLPHVPVITTGGYGAGVTEPKLVGMMASR